LWRNDRLDGRQAAGITGAGGKAGTGGIVVTRNGRLEFFQREITKQTGKQIRKPKCP